jgi:hypothetical protein
MRLKYTRFVVGLGSRSFVSTTPLLTGHFPHHTCFRIRQLQSTIDTLKATVGDLSNQLSSALQTVTQLTEELDRQRDAFATLEVRLYSAYPANIGCALVS